VSYYEKRIAELEARVAQLAREQRLKAIPVEAQLLDRIKELKAEVERLRKAGDALANAFASSLAGEYGNGSETLKNEFLNDETKSEFANWKQAKEGKPSK
jgi:dsRNA-specific ribonuclease